MVCGSGDLEVLNESKSYTRMPGLRQRAVAKSPSQMVDAHYSRQPALPLHELQFLYHCFVWLLCYWSSRILS